MVDQRPGRGLRTEHGEELITQSIAVGVQMKEKQNNLSHSNGVVHLTPYQLEVLIRESLLYFL